MPTQSRRRSTTVMEEEIKNATTSGSGQRRSEARQSATERQIADLLSKVQNGTLQESKQAKSEIKNKTKVSITRVRKLISECKELFIDRDEVIDVLAAGLVSGISIVMMGPPGTAKSAIARAFAKGCGMNAGDSRYFEYLMTNHTMPEELFGGPDLSDLSKGIFRRNTDNKLPVAELAFLDEVFRGGSHILNTLLTIVNEKRFDAGDGNTLHVPLLGVIAAANNPPEAGDLDAFYDRFPIRIWADSILKESARYPNADRIKEHGENLLRVASKGEIKRLIENWQGGQNNTVADISSCASTDDFRWLRASILSSLTESKKSRKEEFHRLFMMCRERLRLSDRSYMHLFLFGAALDLLGVRSLTESFEHEGGGHLDVFKYVARTESDLQWLDDRVRQQTGGSGYAGDQ